MITQKMTFPTKRPQRFRLIAALAISCTTCLFGMACMLAPTTQARASLLPPDPNLADHDYLQGVWRITAMEICGKTTKVDGLEVHFDKDKLVIVRRGYFSRVKDKEEREETTFKLNAFENPKRIDILPRQNAKNMEKSTLGIYELTGNDLKLRVEQLRELGLGEIRPTSFEPDGFATTLFFQRVGK